MVVPETAVRYAAAMVMHALNWWVGYSMLLAAFVTGAVLGLFFHRADWWGGYDSFPRRITRLGHIALAALGMLNILYSLSPWPGAGSTLGGLASVLYVLGGVSMPMVCFLSAWKMGFRHLFFIPVGSLLGAVVCTMLGAA
jgi:hypothetical protein